jgi:hypothetical protein
MALPEVGNHADENVKVILNSNSQVRSGEVPDAGHGIMLKSLCGNSSHASMRRPPFLK